MTYLKVVREKLYRSEAIWESGVSGSAGETIADSRTRDRLRRAVHARHVVYAMSSPTDPPSPIASGMVKDVTPVQLVLASSLGAILTSVVGNI